MKNRVDNKKTIEPKELTDEQLDKVAGGCFDPLPKCFLCSNELKPDEVTTVVISGKERRVCLECADNLKTMGDINIRII